MAVDPLTQQTMVRISKDGTDQAVTTLFAFLTQYQAKGYYIVGSAAPISATIGGGVPDGTLVSQVEKQEIWAYGHSWVSSDFQNTPGCRYIDRTKARTRATTLVNNAYPGSDVSVAAIRGLWDPLYKFPGPTKKALIWLDAIQNGLLISGAWSSVAAQKSAEHGYRSFLAGVSWSSELDDAAMTRVGTGWQTSVGSGWRGGSISYTNVTGDYIYGNVTVNATGKIDVFLIATDANWSLASGAYSIWIDGVQVATGTGLGEHLDTAAALNSGYEPMTVTISGLSAGVHQVKVQREATAGPPSSLWVDGVFVRSTTPPPVFVALCPPMPYAALAAGYGRLTTDLERQTYNQLVASVCQEFPNAVVVDPSNNGWDIPTMLGTDNLHPNDHGHAYLADVYEEYLAQYCPWTPGLHTGVLV